MKTIGLIGGMSWESTADYYRLINQRIKTELGGLHSGKILLVSVDFHEIEQLQKADNWQGAGEILAQAANTLVNAGADALAICTNTMYLVAPQIEQAVSCPLIHIADATGRKIQQQGIGKVGLLGTAFTMEKDFYRRRLETEFGLEVLIPPSEDRAIVHRVIYDELCLGHIKPDSRAHYIDIVTRLHQQGAQAIILGCTEIGMLLDSSRTTIPLYDTTKIHAQAIVEFMLG